MDCNEIVILENKDYNPKAIEIFNSKGKVVFYQKKNYPEAFAIVTRLKHFIGKDFLQQFPHIKYIITPTTGLTHIDLEYTREKKIAIISLKGETQFLQNITATADLTFALILSLVRNIGPAFSSITEKGIWQRDLFRGRDLNCLTLGIWGFGRLGKKLYQYAKSFEMEVLAYDTDPKAFEKSSIVKSPLPQMLSESDIVSLHVDYRPENTQIVNRKIFALMKPGSLFINTSRGELVEEDALLETLQTGHLGGAALDVLNQEHLQNDLVNHPLVQYAKKHHNLIITPHIGGCTIDSMHKTEEFIATKFANFENFL